MVGIVVSPRIRAQPSYLKMARWDDWNGIKQRSGGPALAWSIVGEPRGRHWFAGQVEFETVRNRDNSLRPVSVFKSHVSKRLGAVDEEAAADPALVLDHPVSSAVPTNHE
jgi:hypothetical protein